MTPLLITFRKVKYHFSHMAFTLTRTISFYIFCLGACLIPSSCDDFVQIELAESQVTKSVVFNNEITAEAAITGIYHDIVNDGGFASGSSQSITVVASLSADDLTSYSHSGEYPFFEENDLQADNNAVFKIWESAYKAIYATNAAIEGLSNSTGVSANARTKLLGEAHFIRAFAYFHLVNIFGDVPLITTTDYKLNSSVPRTSHQLIYDLIIEDLKTAKINLSESYTTVERVRPNKATAIALLARVYLYLEDWGMASQMASEVISYPAYSILTDLNQVFLKNSLEAIWQLPPVYLSYNTNEAKEFIFNGFANNIVANDLVTAFDTSDKRLENWIGIYNSEGNTVYFPHKYKAYQFGAPVTEYSMVFRLAEQYLIRAEAEARLGNLTASIADVDIIRKRSGLTAIADLDPNINQDDLLLAIETERRLELFTEYGHRWFDLKRTKRAQVVLSQKKASLTSNDELYPIPQLELDTNPNLQPQNPGY